MRHDPADLFVRILPVPPEIYIAISQIFSFKADPCFIIVHTAVRGFDDPHYIIFFQAAGVEKVINIIPVARPAAAFQDLGNMIGIGVLPGKQMTDRIRVVFFYMRFVVFDLDFSRYAVFP